MNIFRELQKEHDQLLHRQALAEENILNDVQGYVERVIKESTQIQLSNEREQLRANIRYWASYIFEQTGIYPNIELHPTKPPSLGDRLLTIVPIILLSTIIITILPLLSLWSYRALQTLTAPTPTTQIITNLTSTPSSIWTSTLTPTSMPSATPTPTYTLTPLIIPSPDTRAISVEITNLRDQNQVSPRVIVKGTYSNLQSNWSIHVLLQPIAQGGLLYPTTSYYTIPSTRTSGNWSIEVLFGDDSELSNPEQYNVTVVVALTDSARSFLEQFIDSGILNNSMDEEAIVPFPQVITVSRGAYYHINEVRVVHTTYIPDQRSYEIVSVKPDGSDYHQITKTSNKFEYAPSLSPSGKQIAYILSEPNEDLSEPSHYSLWIIDSDGSNSYQIVETLESSAVRPFWSSDGRYIAYHNSVIRESGNSYFQIFLFDTITQEHIQLTDGPFPSTYPSWLPANNSLLYRTSQGIFTLDLATRESIPITALLNTLAVETHPVASFDGTKIALTYFTDSSPQGNRDIYYFDLLTGELHRLTAHTGLDWLPVWHPDGETIYFESHRDTGVPSIWAIDIDGTNERRISSSEWSNTSPYVGYMDAFIPLQTDT